MPDRHLALAVIRDVPFPRGRVLAEEIGDDKLLGVAMQTDGPQLA